MENKENEEQKNTENQAEINNEAETSENIETPEVELSTEEKLALELAEMKDKYIRLYSEFDNFRKRTAKEKIELTQTATANLMVDILPVLDDVDRAKANNPDGEFPEGIQLIINKLTSILQQKGLTEMEAKGTVFDAELHEAITQFTAPTEEEKGKILDVLEKGYYLKDKVVRFAKVVVGN